MQRELSVVHSTVAGVDGMFWIFLRGFEGDFFGEVGTFLRGLVIIFELILYINLNKIEHKNHEN